MSLADEETKAAAFRAQEKNRASFRRRRAREMRGDTAAANALRDRMLPADKSVTVTPESETDYPLPK